MGRSFGRRRVDVHHLEILSVWSGGERCLYIADDNSVAMIVHELKKGGVNVDAAMKSGALEIMTKQSTYLRHGIFEPAKMTNDLIHEVKESLRMGYTAFRAAGEMTWALSLPYALAQLSDYETRLHADFPGQFLSLCQYDERGFSERVIADMIHIHPIVVARGRLLQNRFQQPGATVETLLPVWSRSLRSWATMTISTKCGRLADALRASPFARMEDGRWKMEKWKMENTTAPTQRLISNFE